MRFVLLAVACGLVAAEPALAQNGSGNAGDAEWWQWALVVLAVPVLIAVGVAASGIVRIYDLHKAGVGFLEELKDKIGQFIDHWPSVDPPQIHRGLVVYQTRMTAREGQAERVVATHPGSSSAHPCEVSCS